MNSDRRKRLAEIAAAYVEIVGELDSVRDSLESVRDEEQEAFDNLPESLQDGERGQSYNAISYLEQAIEALDSLLGEEIESLIENARD